MAITVHCDIVSAEAEIFSDLVEMVIAHDALGDLGIVPGHAPLIINLKPDPIRLAKQGGEQKVYYISDSFLEVQSSMAKALAGIVVHAGDLDEAVAQEALKAAGKVLQSKGARFDYSTVAARLAETAAQLRAIQQLHKKFDD